jgi:hypothetical protein
VWIAWLIARGTSSAQAGSQLHFTSGRSKVSGSTMDSSTSCPTVLRTYWPANTTSGLCE